MSTRINYTSNMAVWPKAQFNDATVLMYMAIGRLTRSAKNIGFDARDSAANDRS